jgi:DNA end-binding protein Ku
LASTVWRGYITFGLVSIPIRLFRAARPERVSLRQLAKVTPDHKAHLDIEEESLEESRAGVARKESASRLSEPRDTGFSSDTEPERLVPVKQAAVLEDDTRVLRPKSIVKGYEFEKSRFVAVEPDELKAIASKTSTEMAIQEFVKLAEIDPVYFETSYYVRPEEVGEKAYALLFSALKSSGLVALAEFSMHTRDHVAIVRSGRTGLLAHTMFYESEIRREEEHRTDISLVAEKELQLAEKLIASLTARFEPEKYRDTYRERLEALIAGKVKSQKPAALPPARARKEVIDIEDALRRSLSILKKPVSRAGSKTARAHKATGPT